MDPAPLSLGLTPHGRLALSPDAEEAPLDSQLLQRLQDALERGSGHGLLLLGADEAGASLPPSAAYWREFGARYVTALCSRQDGKRPEPPPDDELDRIALLAPPMTGGEYLTVPVLRALWEELDRAF